MKNTNTLTRTVNHSRIKKLNYIKNRILLFLFSLLTSGIFGQLASWNPAGLSGYGPSPWPPTSSTANLTVGGLTRGTGVGSGSGAAGNAWGGNNWLGGINDDVTFTVTANSGYQVSYSSFNLFYRRSSTGPATGVLAFAFGASTTYTTLGSFVFSSTSSTGALHAPISLTGIAALQNVPAGTVVKFRILPAAGSSSAGTWYVFSTAGLSIAGTVSAAAPSFSAAISQASPIPCNGLSAGSLSVSVSGGTPPYTYSWVPAGGTSSTAISLAAGAYSCFITSTSSATTLATFILAEPAMLSSNLSGQNNVSCNGGSNGSATITSTGGTPAYTYSWSPIGGNAAIANNLTAGEYTVNISDSRSCTTTQTISITEPSTLITITANTSSSVICEGSTVTLNGSGANTYTWTSSVIDGAAFSPSATTSYSVTGTDNNGCQGYASISITVNPSPTITVNSGAICPGNAFVLTPGGASTYTFSSVSATVMPATLSTYSVYGTSADGCVADFPAVATVTVTGSLTVTISGPTSICNGDAVNLTANGATSYTWSTGDFNYTVAPTPSINTTYSVIGASGSCSNSAVTTVTVNSLPVISVFGSSVICAGETITLTAGGASTYSWNTSQTTSMITQAPATSTTYVAVGTDINGCSNIATQSVTVNPAPAITVSNGTICSGGSFSFNPSGANTYSFSGGASVSPTVTTTYSVSGTSSLGCISLSPAISTITVISLPVITVNSGSICSGKSFTMNPSGASSYTFSNGSFTASPTGNTSYSVTGTSSLGCISASPAVSNVTVHALPLVTVNNGTVCAGKTFTMVPGGAATYSFSNGSATVIPTVNSSYSVTGTSSVGCVSSTPAISSVTVNAVPVLTVSSGTICAGSIFTLVPSGAATYTFSNGSATVSPATTTSYSVSGTSSLGCVSNGSVVSTVTVINLPLVTVNSGTICAGSTFTMLPGGAFTYTFSSGSATVSPAVTTSYSVSGTNSAGCISTLSAVSTVTVRSLPAILIAGSSTLCNGNGLNLTASGATTYTWNTNSNSALINVTPSVTTTFSVSGTNTMGCSSSTSATITVFPSPSISLPGGFVCPGGTFTLSPSGASTYTFSNGPVVSPAVTTSYTVTGTNSLGCVSLNSATAIVTVTNSLLVSITGATLVCDGMPANITASGAGTYTWNTGALGSTIAPTPSVNTTYTVTGSSGACSDTAVISVSVLPSPTVSILSTNTAVCLGQSATLTATGANTYTWTGGIINGSSITPTATTTYTVYAEGVNGCVGSGTVQIPVFPNPTVTASSTRSLLCKGETATLTAIGASTYSWNTNATTFTAIVSPSVTTSYTVIGKDANGCVASSSISQMVSNCASIKSFHQNRSEVLSVFPNPNNGDFFIKSEVPMHVVLINELGQKVQVIYLDDLNNYEEQIRALTPGMYFVKSEAAEFHINQKIIVTR